MLPDVLAPNLKIVFCGTAVGDKSAETKAYYADPTNRFWSILHKVGLTPKKIKPTDYETITSYGLGLTDLAKNTHGVDKKLCSSDFDCEALTGKITKYKPNILCFNGKQAAKEYLKNENIDYGFQKETIGSTRIYIAPSTSGAASRYWDEKWWYLLADTLGTKLKKVNRDNYYEPDEICKLLRNVEIETGQISTVTEVDFINAIKDVKLHYSIPLDIRNMFEVAKALFSYGFLYYQFCTLALEQALKSLEALISQKYTLAGGPETTKNGHVPGLKFKIDFLYSKGIIRNILKEKVDVFRHLRNQSFHPTYQQVIGHYSGYLQSAAQIMNEIWLT